MKQQVNWTNTHHTPFQNIISTPASFQIRWCTMGNTQCNPMGIIADMVGHPLFVVGPASCQFQVGGAFPWWQSPRIFLTCCGKLSNSAPAVDALSTSCYCNMLQQQGSHLAHLFWRVLSRKGQVNPVARKHCAWETLVCPLLATCCQGRANQADSSYVIVENVKLCHQSGGNSLPEVTMQQVMRSEVTVRVNHYLRVSGTCAIAFQWCLIAAVNMGYILSAFDSVYVPWLYVIQDFRILLIPNRLNWILYLNGLSKSWLEWGVERWIDGKHIGVFTRLMAHFINC